MLRVVTLCSGYDSQCLALNRLGIEYELIAWSEIDKYAIQAHNALFPQYSDRNLGDMTKIDWNKVPDFDLLTYSTPCQSISTAGLQHGFQEGSGTRSSIIWFVREAIKVKKPRYLMLENVAAMVSQKFLPMFHLWQHELEKYGYTNYAQILNAKNYGVPQNRERIFMISKLDDEPYYFPKPFKLERRLKDVLENDVDEKYYLSDKLINFFYKNTENNKAKGNGFKFEPQDGSGIAKAITTRAGDRMDDNFIQNSRLVKTLSNNEISKDEPTYIDAYNNTIKKDITGTISTRVNASNCTFISEPKRNVIGNVMPSGHESGNILNVNGISGTIKENHGCPCLISEKPMVKQIGNIVDDSNRNFSNPQYGRVYSSNGISPTLNTMQGGGREPKIIEPICLNSKVDGKQPSAADRIYDKESIAVTIATGWIQNVNTPRIRKLTPRECFRLMGVDDVDIDKIQARGISKSQQYKMAGNSIVVDCMVYIFKKLLIDKENEEEQLTLF